MSLFFFYGGQMGFHDLALFPETVARGSSGGPRFNTQVVKLDGGGEHRLARWTDPVRKYDVRGGIKTQADAYAVLEFFYARLGATYGFRYKDWSDYATTPTGTTYRDNDAALAFDDAQTVVYNPGGADHGMPGVGNGLRTQFQLAKQYTSGGIARTRTIQKPKASTVLVGHNGIAQGTGWTLDDVGGVITFTTAPGVGVVTWGGEFFVPCRFSTDVDQDGLVAQVEDYDNYTNPRVSLEEIRSGLTVPEERFMGGAKNWGLTAGNISLQVGQGAAQLILPNANIDAILPAPDLLPPGTGYFHIYNDSAVVDALTITVKDSVGITLVVIQPQTSALVDLVLGVDGLPLWLSFNG